MGEETKEEFIEKNSEALHIPEATYIRIVVSSFEASQQDILDLKKAIDECDYNSIKTIAHRLKGVYGNLKMAKIFSLTQEIDALAKAQEGIEKIKEKCDQLVTAFESLKATFR